MLPFATLILKTMMRISRLLTIQARQRWPFTKAFTQASQTKTYLAIIPYNPQNLNRHIAIMVVILTKKNSSIQATNRLMTSKW
jgi:hypothetical protein